MTKRKMTILPFLHDSKAGTKNPFPSGAGPQVRLVTILGAMLPVMLAILLLQGCGEGKENQVERFSRVTEVATAFLNALGDRQVKDLRGMMTEEYLEGSGVPDPITADDLLAALGYLVSYRFSPDRDVTLTNDRATITVWVKISGREESEETLALKLVGGDWKVDAFTALDWSKRPRPSDEEEEVRVQVEQALRDFLIACLDGRTDYIFEHLSPEYRERHRLEKPWTAAEFSGVFGTARSYDFDPREIDLEEDRAQVDVTIEFGTRGNLESETSRVRLVKKGENWLIDAFPFFIY